LVLVALLGAIVMGVAILVVALPFARVLKSAVIVTPPPVLSKLSTSVAGWSVPIRLRYTVRR